jgi:hypothetical protein
MTSTAAERRVEVRPPAPERPRYGLLAGLALGLLPAELYQSIFATALPAVVAELGGLAGLALINTSYVLAGAVAMLLIGPLGDRFGGFPVFVWASVAFLAGSVLGGVAPTLPVLVAARVVQGLGGGGLLVLIQAIIADLVAPRRRAWYLAVVDTTYTVAAVSGPVLGGWLAEYASWRWAFWLNLPRFSRRRRRPSQPDRLTRCVPLKGRFATRVREVGCGPFDLHCESELDTTESDRLVPASTAVEVFSDIQASTC